jgi:hypothetical protein
MVSFLLLAAAAAAQAAPQQPLALTCFGGGTAKKVTVINGGSTGYVSGMVGTTPVSGTVSGSSSVVIPRSEGFSDQVDVRLFGGDDRIRLPASTIPSIHGGNAGWFRLKDVVADAHSIHAKAEVNFINKPSIYIDRVTGTISIAGKDGHYTGQCQIIDANAPAKF